MKKYFLLFSIFIIGLSACTKNEVATQAAVDDQKIQAYLKANHITATKDTSGLYYSIITPGPNPNDKTTYPTVASTAKVAYTGKYLNGVGFDSNPSYSIDMNSTSAILGFRYGLKLINTGGRILLIIPSGLAYGAAGDGSIPPNAVLIFTVDMLGFYATPLN